MTRPLIYIFLAYLIYLFSCKPMPTQNQKQGSNTVDSLVTTASDRRFIVKQNTLQQENLGLFAFDTAVRKLLDTVMIAVLEKPTKMQAYAINPSAVPDSTSRLFEKFVILDSLQLSSAQRAVFNFLIQDSASYRVSNLKLKQPFTPVVVFHFEREGQKASVYVSFDTDQFGLQTNSAGIRQVFFTCRHQLLRLCKGLFPDNPYLKFY